MKQDFVIKNCTLFKYLGSEETVKVPDGIREIASQAFRMNKGIKRVILPETVEVIATAAFQFCASLTSVNLPDSVDMIGREAFYGCDELVSLRLPAKLTSIGARAFCTDSLKSIEVPEDAVKYASADGVLFTKDMKCLIMYPQGKDGNEYTVPEGVTQIADYAFYRCSRLNRVKLPDSVTDIGGSAFSNCHALISITLPEGVTRIPESLFIWCTSLARAEIKGKIAEIGNYAFSNCHSLGSLTLPDTVTSIGENAFFRCRTLKSLRIPESVASIGYGAFTECESLSEINLPDSIVSVSSTAFKSCTSLERIDLPPTLERIEDGAFSGSGLRKADIPLSVKHIGSYAFAWCDELTSVNIPENAEVMEYAFTDSGLRELFVPDSTAVFGSIIDNTDVDRIYIPCSDLKCLDPAEKVNYAVYFLTTADRHSEADREVFLHYIKRQRKKILCQIVKCRVTAALAKALEMELIPLKDMDMYIGMAKGSTEITAMLMEYKHSRFTPRQTERENDKRFTLE